MEGGTVYDLQVLDEGKKEETKSSGTFELILQNLWFSYVCPIQKTLVKMLLNQR